MNKKLLLLSAFLAGASWTVLAQDLVLSEGQYYTDETQTTPYTGRYTEFYEDGMLKMELYMKDGRPEGSIIRMARSPRCVPTITGSSMVNGARIAITAS